MAAHYGHIIQYYRKMKGYTQSELAKELGVSGKCVSAWEVGRNEPNMKMLEKMSEIFACKKSDLLGGEDSTDPEIAELITLYQKADELTKQMVMRLLRQ